MFDFKITKNFMDVTEIAKFADTIPNFCTPRYEDIPDEYDFKKYYNTESITQYFYFDDDEYFPDFNLQRYFDYRNISAQIIYQCAGTFAQPHFDHYGGHRKRFGLDYDHKVFRHLITLDKGHPGQAIFLWDDTHQECISNWEPGTMIWWQPLLWHSTANAGVERRITLTVTGNY